jgi:hypothetical protein
LGSLLARLLASGQRGAQFVQIAGDHDVGMGVQAGALGDITDPVVGRRTPEAEGRESGGDQRQLVRIGGPADQLVIDALLRSIR